MGHAVEQQALLRNHRIVAIYDQDFAQKQQLPQADVCIEFSVPSAAYSNCKHALMLELPIVSGTTGWQQELEELKEWICSTGRGTLFHASNFSLGVNILFAMNRKLARIMEELSQYIPSISETHHIHKVDAPSGTALSLAHDIIAEHSQLTSWALSKEVRPDTLSIESIREGEVPGKHSVAWQSKVDCLTLSHEAFGREGFALGAVLAAEYAISHQGVLSMQTMLGLDF